MVSIASRHLPRGGILIDGLSRPSGRCEKVDGRAKSSCGLAHGLALDELTNTSFTEY